MGLIGDKMKIKIICFTILLLTVFSCCSSSRRQTKLKAKYDVIVNNFELGEHSLTSNKYNYLSDVLQTQAWNGVQFAIEFQSDTKVLVWWTDNPADEGVKKVGAWSIDGNVFTLRNVGKYSGSYEITSYNFEKLSVYYFSIYLNKDVGIDGYESNELTIKMN